MNALRRRTLQALPCLTARIFTTSAQLEAAAPAAVASKAALNKEFQVYRCVLFQFTSISLLTRSAWPESIALVRQVGP